MRTDKRKHWTSEAVVAAGFGLLLLLEKRRGLRQSVEPKGRRLARNLAVAGASAALLNLAERPVSVPLARLVERRRLGILQRFRLAPWLEATLAVLLLDYTLYLWHVLEHRSPALWRFHAVHHVDLDMDASTALRFHFGELAASIPWRAGQIVLIGVTPRSLRIYQRLLMLSVIFHHSNVRLPMRLEEWLSRFIMTPRLHGIHHSVIGDEINSNWSSGLTIWDRMHRTLRVNALRDEVTVGLIGIRNPADVTLANVLKMPFRRGIMRKVVVSEHDEASVSEGR